MMAHLGTGLVLVILLAPCAPAPEAPELAQSTGATTASNGTPPESGEEDAPEEVPPPPAPPPAPPEPPTLRRRALPLVSEASDAMDRRFGEIASRGERDAHIFAKMGGSSVESRAYLHCFSSGRNLRWGEHEHLQPVLDFFREGRIGRDDPFERESLVAQVGWSLRQGLTGRPSRAIQEIRATNARFALAFWGGNDVQGRNPRRYAERLLQLIESLERRGVIPLLAATTPRGDDPAMDVWARRYNVVTRGLAEALHLPFLDFYAAISDLPNRGLARDGVHPNVAREEGRSLPCSFEEAGLNRGQNRRNLHTLELLGLARESLERGQAQLRSAPIEEAGSEEDETTSAPAERWIESVPFSEVAAGGAQRRSDYTCEGAPNLPGPESVYRVRVEESIALDARLYRGEGVILYLGQNEGCTSFAENELSMILEPGDHTFVVERTSDLEPILILSEPIAD